MQRCACFLRSVFPITAVPYRTIFGLNERCLRHSRQQMNVLGVIGRLQPRGPVGSVYCAQRMWCMIKMRTILPSSVFGLPVDSLFCTENL